MDENTKKTSRRNFFGKMALFGTGAVAGAAVIYSGLKYESSKDDKKKIQLLTADNKLVEVDAEALKEFKPSPLEALQMSGREGIPGRRWVMVVDMSKCRNARKCVESCQHAHDLKPGQYHMNVLQMKDSPETAPYNMPKPCQHCDNPPCVSVCPVDATFKRQDGIVLIDNERCIGCRFCMAACPYSARIFHWLEPKVSDENKNKEYNVELNVPQKKGTISKCLFSADRLREGKLPYCVSACPNGVYWFGDENEDAVTNGTTKETARLSTLLEKNGAHQLMPELGTKPRVYYLPPKNRAFPFEKTNDPIEQEEG
jgi:Fe-S-cluster-containing dehydrogenase component